MDNSKRYIEIAIGHPGNRGVVIAVDELTDYLHQGSLFRSYYSFDDSLVEHFKVRKTIKNYQGIYRIA